MRKAIFKTYLNYLQKRSDMKKKGKWSGKAEYLRYTEYESFYEWIKRKNPFCKNIPQKILEFDNNDVDFNDFVEGWFFDEEQGRWYFDESELCQREELPEDYETEGFDIDEERCSEELFRLHPLESHVDFCIVIRNPEFLYLCEPRVCIVPYEKEFAIKIYEQ